MTGLTEVPGEGRWVLMTEALFRQYLDLVEREQGITLTAEWGEPDTREVTFYTPRITRSDTPRSPERIAF